MHIVFILVNHIKFEGCDADFLLLFPLQLIEMIKYLKEEILCPFRGFEIVAKRKIKNGT